MTKPTEADVVTAVAIVRRQEVAYLKEPDSYPGLDQCIASALAAARAQGAAQLARAILTINRNCESAVMAIASIDARCRAVADEADGQLRQAAGEEAP
jgi:hypothetical protein